MTQIDRVQQRVQGYFNHRSGTNYVRVLDTPRVWGMPFDRRIMPQAWARQADFERALEEIVQNSVFRCDLSSLNCPDPDWAGVVLGAMDTALSAKMGRQRPTQFKFLFGQTPMVPVGEPANYTLFKDALVRLVRNRGPEWEMLPEIWLGRFYRLREGILSTAQMKVFGGDGILGSDDTKMTWNHTKIVAADGTEALVGGHNLNMDLFRSYPPVHDLSVVVHGPAALGAQLFLDEMWQCGTDLITKEELEPTRLVWIDRDQATPQDVLRDPYALTQVALRQGHLLTAHLNYDPDDSESDDDSDGDDQGALSDDEQTLLDLDAPVFPLRVRHQTYDAFDEYKLATDVLAVGKYWKGSGTAEYQKASELMKQELIAGARDTIRMSQMDLISAWKKNWSDHVVCQWLMQALLANDSLTVQVVVSPLDAGAGAEGDQYSFGSGARRTFDLIRYYMTHDVQTDDALDDRDGRRAEALTRLQVAPLYFTDSVPAQHTAEGATYFWPGLSPEGYTTTLKQPPLSESPPRKGVIGSAAWSVINASGLLSSRRVPSAPGNHAKLTVVDDEAYVVGSDNLYPGFLSEFNYLIEGPDAVGELLDAYWKPLWLFSGPHAVSGPPAQ